MEGRIQKILQGRDYPISSTYWTQTSPTHIYSNKNNHNDEWDVSLDAPFIWPCATSKQKA